ncbi:glycoside hydrolase family 43 protein [Segatella bryantii]|jgi:alpha-N-arabinofuranosidase|uniref:glycoside hydrolase family 43 protein n=1 Tax=Segatella bryantii TaxID=77095 RepID=UPI002478E171|nr:glycoside hydrolase family 43 protein [Segatella bryantii]
MKRLSTFFVFVCCVLALFAQSKEFRNPIIPGFHPDPSICRVGSDFYLVNSSFNYFPGVPIFHSKDLIHWQQIGNVLNRESQLPLQGANSWTGIYAPTLRYYEGVYYMITTNIGHGGNFLVTAKNPQGPWSEPVWLEQQGIDPSLYFEHGKCYMVSNPDNTIMLCEIDVKTGKQLTPSRAIWHGDGGRYPEGPHIYKKDGYYYLLISEGGTELAHHLTIARSKNIAGPYESNPANPILTNCNMKGQLMQIQGTGHGDFVQAPDGSWWITFLAYRNMGGSYHHLGRETCIAPVKWDEGQWPIVYNLQPIDTLMQASLLPAVEWTKSTGKIVFSSGQLGPQWVYLQNPVWDNYQFVSGKLRLKGGWSSLTENNRPTFLGLRQEAERIVLETQVTPHGKTGFESGLTVYQINDGHYDLFVQAEKNGKYAVGLRYVVKNLPHNEIVFAHIDNPYNLKLRVRSGDNQYYFDYAEKGMHYKNVGQLSSTLLSTEVVGGFTGVTLGMYAQGSGYADFAYFDYVEQ